MEIYKEAVMNLTAFLLYIKKEKTMQIKDCMVFIIRNKGMGEIFHDQTKGYKFVCDSLHNI